MLINDPTSPKSYVFHEDVPPGGHIGVNPDGSATIYDATGKPVSQIAKPWAYDALGRPQKTWYTVDENGNLVQHVQPSPDAVYPIVADPTDASSLGQCTPDDPDGNGIAGYQPPQQPQTSTSTANPDGSITTNTTDGHGGTITSTSTPVPDSGGSVDTTINNADGTTTQTRSVPDGQGGVTTWTANPDGSNSVVYPDGTAYTEPGSSNQGYGVSTPTGDGGVHTDCTSPEGTQYTADSTPNYDGSIHTETDTPQGHVSSNSAVVGSDGTILTQATTPEGQQVMTRTDSHPDGSVTTTGLEKHVILPDGRDAYIQPDGKIWIPDNGQGSPATIDVHPDNSISVDQADGLSYDILPDGSIRLRMPEGTDVRGSLTSAAIEGAKGIYEIGGMIAQPGRHTLNAGDAAAAASGLRLLGRAAGPIGTVATIASGAADLVNGAPVPETIGSTAGGLAGATLGSAAGAGAGTYFGIATAAAIGAGAGSAVPVVGTVIGAAIGAGVGAWVGSTYGRNIGEGARKVWNTLFG
ncbi:hypothetical protein [Gordonia polyisoprenivorans]|uniref:hypothetical protein n=1 Tax=Gordonia polyisoprenivorans TaxID=84595 RepID=UPI001AD6B322|nr:hypothetical protein [Gordonia polyisoprenivorans]QTI67276.1 hypothetical protein J6U32_16815 [Gordonia polyisoprenivorans]